MPKTAYDEHPAATAHGLHEFLLKHAPDIARRQLAQWDLGPKLTRHQNGALDLTAFHDPEGHAAVRYHRTANGEISLTAASPHQRLPRWLEPPKSYRPDPRRQRKPGRTDAPKLPVLSRLETDNQLNLALSCTDLIRILQRQLALRVTVAAASVASDYLPNRAIKYALNPRLDHWPTHSRHDPMPQAEYAAQQAILEAIPNATDRNLTEKHLPEQNSDLFELLLPDKPARGGSLRRPPIRSIHKKTINRLDSAHTLPRRRPQGTGPLAAAAQLNTDLVAELLDPEATRTLLALCGTPKQPRHARITQSSICDYNTIRSSPAAYALLAQSEPGLARIYMSTQGKPGQRLTSPKPMIDRLRRKQCQDDGAKWEYFRRIANIPSLRLTNDWYISLAAEAAAIAGRKDAPDRSLITLCDSSHIINDRKRFNRRHGSQVPRTAWQHTLHAFLDPAIPAPTTGQLDMVSQALSGHLKQGLPWKPDTWPELVRRAARWLHDLLAGPDLDEDANAFYDTNPNRPWAKHERGHYLLTPLNSIQREDVARHLLGFPVHADMTNVHQGQTLAYIATAPHRPPAAIQLSSKTRSWEVSEILAPKGRKPSSAMHQMAQELAADLRAHDPLPLRPPPEWSPDYLTGYQDRFHVGPMLLYADTHRTPTYADIVGKELLYADPTPVDQLPMSLHNRADVLPPKTAPPALRAQ